MATHFYLSEKFAALEEKLNQMKKAKEAENQKRREKGEEVISISETDEGKQFLEQTRQDANLMSVRKGRYESMLKEAGKFNSLFNPFSEAFRARRAFAKSIETVEKDLKVLKNLRVTRS